MSLFRPLFLLCMTVLLLVACGEIREDLGLGRNTPDEFAVVERPPLSLPPDFGLHPPRPGAPRPQAVDTADQASAVLFNSKTASQAQAPSEAEKALLEATGATKSDPNIRETVDRESAQKVVASPHLIERLLNGKGEKPSTTVDATAEAERIKKAKEENKPITTGATPVIEKQTSGWLGL